jgi:hypothetical protein
MMCRRMSFRRQWMEVWKDGWRRFKTGEVLASERMCGWLGRAGTTRATELSRRRSYSTCGWAAVQNESRCSARFERVECGRSVLLICKQKAQAS